MKQFYRSSLSVVRWAGALLCRLLLIVCGTSAVFAQSEKCAGLTAGTFGAEVKIEAASLVAATSSAPEHCDVRGVILPEAKFAVKLPTTWNNRFYMVGGGG